MYQIFAQFGKIESLALYNMVESLNLNVMDLTNEVILYGEISLDKLEYIEYVCHKFGSYEISIIQKEPA